MYKVGQVIFVLHDLKVIPVQVVEQNVKITLDGEEITYIVMPPKKDKRLNLSKVNGEIYVSLHDAKAAMIENAMAAINKMIKSASTVAEKSFEQVTLEPEEGLADYNVDDYISESANNVVSAVPPQKENQQIQLENGVKANISMSENTKQALGIK
jgi:DNA repair exonuclease SbcCD nuclease subunit